MSEKTFIPVTYVEKTIKKYFLTNLPQYCEGDDAWTIHWNPTVTFSRPDDLYWLDFFFMNNEPFQQELGTGGRNRHKGVLQINICTPLDAVKVTEDDPIGTSPMDICADDIARIFRRGVTFDGIRIVKCYKETSALEVYDDFCCLPISIYWEADLSN